MVGSTELSQRLEPEDLDDLLKSYQRVCRDAIVRHGGFVYQYLGDGVLAYFGYRIAHGDDAERAIRASLSILETIKLTNQGIGRRLHEEVHVRVGLHTGVVAITGGLGGAHERRAVGETVNLASHIQAVAPVDSVLMSTATAQLAGGYFEVEALKAQLKGSAEPVELFRVVRPTGARSKLEAAARGKLTPHVGRETELAELTAAWNAVQDGAARTVVLIGEAGIGKSRVLHQFRRAVLDEGVSVLECFCSPLTRATALAPVIDMLDRRVVEYADGVSTPEAKLKALRAMISEHSRFSPDALPLIAALLSIPGADESPIQELSPVRRRARTLEQLGQWLAFSAERVPVALLFEDVHWADPSTLELLDMLVSDEQRGRTLLCMTMRPIPNRWQEITGVSTIELARLSTPEIQSMITHVDSGGALPRFFTNQIAQRSEGVPLYAEEITKLVLDRLKSGGAEHAMRLGEQLLPSTLLGMLQGRLDQVGRGRRTAQLGSVIGREFSYTLIRAVTGDVEEILREDLDGLRQSELVFVHGEAPHATYSFKHALIQDAIYKMLPKSERESFHDRIFLALEREFLELVQARPEMAAYHAEKANRREAAVRLFCAAGSQALGRTAVVEAVQHLRHGLRLVETLEEPARTNWEIELQAAIGPAYMATIGWAAPEVEKSSQRLLELATARGIYAKVYQAMWGLWTVHFVRGELHAAFDIGQKVYEAARASGDPMLRITGCHALGYSSYYRAQLESARDIAEEALEISNLEIETRMTSVFQLSSGSIIHGFCAAAHWLLGRQERAAEVTIKWHALLSQLKHPPSTALSLGFEGYLLHMQREPRKLGELASRLQSISQQEGFSLWIPMSRVFRAWALAHEGQVEVAVDEMAIAIAEWRATNSELTMCDNTVMQVEVLLLAGRAPDALRAIAEGKAICLNSGERTLEPELFRLEGEALEMLGLRGAAITASMAAIDRAKELRALSLELRAATQLHRLAKTSGSLEQLRNVYLQFTEGFDKPDLQAARSHLNAETISCAEQAVGT